MQNDILSVNRAQVAIAETLNRLSADMIKIEERISANEQKMNANMQVFLDELTRQESDIFYLKNITAPPPAIKNYVVKSGDSLGALAEKFNTTVDALKKANKLKDDVIHPGQKLILP
ncbi:MAG: LysM peptidoglycan-binding domain-containing protein [Candidatus Omnitrophica bacterium]|nr:LysM peptidoglycan-binding domain-containing protein [Candidatus Omnitrophota bacterium]